MNDEEKDYLRKFTSGGRIDPSLWWDGDQKVFGCDKCELKDVCNVFKEKYSDLRKVKKVVLGKLQSSKSGGKEVGEK